MTPCKRRCWNCGNVADHEDNITPHVNCKKCGSQDTRLIKPPEWKPVVNKFAEMTVRCIIREIDGDKAIVGVGHHDMKVPLANLREDKLTA